MNLSNCIILILFVLADSNALNVFSIINEPSTENCTCKGYELYGRIQFVESFPDLKVQIVSSFPDLKVKVIDRNPSRCGEWRIVDKFPDLKVKIVNSFPDIRIQYVQSFPGKINSKMK